MPQAEKLTDASRSLADLLLDPGGGPAGSELVWFEDRWSSRSDISTAARELAGVLAGMGVGPGDVVASLVDTSPRAVAALFGIWASGAAVVPLNPRTTRAERERILAEVAPAAIVVVGETAPDGVGERPLVLGEKLAWRAVDGPTRSHRASLPDGVALVLFTSGTTGPPKPVLLRHRGTLDALEAVLRSMGGRPAPNAESADSSSQTPGRPPMPNLITFPLCLWSGIYNVCFSLRVGAPMLLLGPFEPRRFAEIVRRFGIRSAVLAPAMIGALVEEPTLAELGPLRFVRNGTAPLTPRMARRFHARFGVPILNGWGQTELGGEVVGWNTADIREYAEAKLGAVGRPHPGIEIKVLDDEGRSVDDGQVGELCVRSPYVMAGYLSGGNPDRFTPEGLLRTGDLGRVDEDGFVWLAGRVSDVVNRSGLKVFPGEVEDVILGDEAVAEVAVAGIPDERVGEVPCAFVVLRGEVPPDLEERLEARCRESLSPYKVPARIVVVERLPRNEAGKVLRRELRC
ncbi:MAG: class I adenylate-forming enzyme family protein [Acidimicrobiales bacterium]